MKLLIEDITKTPEQFQEVHGKGIFLGSSEIATVAGLNRFQTPLQLWMRKTGRDTSDQGNFHTKLGNLMEEVVAKLFLDEKKEYVGTKNVSVYQHDTIEFATCTPDYFLHTPISSGTEALLEIKTSGAWANKDWSEAIPDYALIQLQWQLGIMNLSQGYLAALIGGKEFYVKEVPFNADVFSQLVEMGTKFVEMIKSDTAPDAKFNDDFSFLKPTEKEIELSDCAEMLQEYQLLSNELAVSNSFIRLKEQARDEIKNKLIQKMGDAGLAKCGNFIVTRKIVEMKESLRKAHQQIRFNVKENKEK